MTDNQAAAPKRTAMQIALNAEKAAAELRGELENVTALMAATTDGPLPDGQADVILHQLERRTGDALAQLRDQVGDLLDWRAGFLGADGPKGVSKIAEMAESHDGALRELIKDFGQLHGNVAHIAQQLAAMPDYAGSDSKLKPQALFDSVLAVDGRLRNIEEWQAAELDEDRVGDVDAVADLTNKVISLEAQLRELRAQPAPMKSSAAGGAPHVLGLIAQLQKRVYEIGKGREFKAENQRGDVTQQYSFRGIDEAQNAIGSAQREIGLIGPKVTIVEKDVKVVEVNKGSYTQVWTTVSVTARYTFQSPVDGSEWSTEGCGMGRDLGDKAESKALAGAFKYALFHGLNIPVKGVFVDAETADPRIEREHQRQDQGQYAGESGRTYGHGQPPSDPADQYGDAMTSQAFDRAMQDPTPANVQQSLAARPAAPVEQPQRAPDNRTPEELARDAIAAVRRAANAHEAAGVWRWIYERQLLKVPVDGVPIGQHMLAAIRLLPGGDQVELPGWGQFR